MRLLLLVLLLPAGAAELELTDRSRKSLRRLSEYYKEAPHRVRPDVDSAASFFGRLKDVFAGVPVPVTLDVEVSWKGKARVAASAELAGRRLEVEEVEAPLVDARVRLREDLYRELQLAGERAAAGLAKQLAALGPLSAAPEKSRLALDSPEAGRPAMTDSAQGGKRVEAINPRPYKDELLSALAPEGVFSARSSENLTLFDALELPGCFVEVRRQPGAPEPRAWRKRLLARFDLLHSRGWEERRGSAPWPWAEQSIRFEGSGQAGWVLIGRGYRVVSVCSAAEDGWFQRRAGVILSSLKVN